MEDWPFEVVVSWLPEDYELVPDGGREQEIFDRMIAKKDRERVFDRTKRPVYVPYPQREWQFHKNDRDNWPSALHGHHCQEPLKLDAITGDIWKIPEKKLFSRIKEKELIRIHRDLMQSKDLAEKSRLYLGADRVKIVLT
jgi:hypothetical protein